MGDAKFRVLMLTPIYPGEGVMKSTTPVVHYFTREWVKNGVDVRVIHYPSNFPNIVNFVARQFRSLISSKTGQDVRTWNLDERMYIEEGVKVYRVPMKKFLPHSRYRKKIIDNAISKTIDYCYKECFTPNVIVGHWVNPQFDIMYHLKRIFKVPTCFVAHDYGEDLLGIYSKEAQSFINETNILGYRSESIKKHFEQNFNCSSIKNFQCYSGIPSKYVEDITKKIDNRRSMVFVGTLIERKYPSLLVEAAVKAYGDDDFNITYIGAGHEDITIRNIAEKNNVSDKVHLLGRLKRDEVVKQLDSHTLFVMISKREAFGLVYLEAMARGCITIASRDEGFDGIIKDGVNGFLCKAGDSDELAEILKRIQNMPRKELQRISDSAVQTAHRLTDEKAANYYLDQLRDIVQNS